MPLALFPLINDVTTDFRDPPRFEAVARLPEHAGKSLSYPAEFAAIQKRIHPRIAPLHLQLAPAEAFRKVLQAARSMKRWRIVCEDSAALKLEAVATTALLRFRDDVAVEVRPSGAGSEVHMRSRSRVGKGDLGANAQRIERFFERLRAVTQSLPDRHGAGP